MITLPRLTTTVFVLMNVRTLHTATPGGVCKRNGDCSSELLYCSDSVCICNETASYTQYQFSDRGTTSNISCKQARCRKSRISCLAGKCIPWNGSTGFGRCLCDKGKGVTVTSDGNGYNVCKIIFRAEVGDMCSQYVNVCDIKKGLYCTDSRCVCKADKIYDFNKKRCISRAVYLKERGMIRYVGGIDGYCRWNSDCGKTFQCSRRKTCKCATGCGPYLQPKGMCYCEKVPSISYTVAWCIGGVVAAAILCLCCCCCTYSKKKPTAEILTDAAELGEQQQQQQQQELLYNANTTPTAPDFTSLDLPPSYEEAVGRAFEDDKL